MLMRPVNLPAEVGGRLWFSSMPGRFEPWAEFLDTARRAELGLVVCLTPLDEMAALSPAYRTAVDLGALPFRWRHAPMRNFGLPTSLQAFREDIAATAAALRGGEAVLIHCAAGIGRTGSAGTCLLKTLGVPLPLAMQAVREAGASPESAMQAGLVDRF